MPPVGSDGLPSTAQEREPGLGLVSREVGSAESLEVHTKAWRRLRGIRFGGRRVRPSGSSCASRGSGAEFQTLVR